MMRAVYTISPSGDSLATHAAIAAKSQTLSRATIPNTLYNGIATAGPAETVCLSTQTGPEFPQAEFLTEEVYRKHSRYLMTEEVACRMPLAETIFVRSQDMTSAFGFPKENVVDCSKWVREVGGILSSKQIESLQQNGRYLDRSQFDTVGTLRPPRYGRAAVVSTRRISEVGASLPCGDGLLDIKGCGISLAKTPVNDPSIGNGICFLHQGIREFINFYILRELSLRTGSPFDVLPLWALVDLGIAIQVPNLPPLPICTIIRAPHFRDPENCERPSLGSEMLSRKVEIERFLQSFGISSALNGFKVCYEGTDLRLWHDRKRFKLTTSEVIAFADRKGLDVPGETSGINIQLCDRSKWTDRSRTLVDFLQHYRCVDEVPHRLSVALSRDGDNYWGATLVNKDQHPNIEGIRHFLGVVDNVEQFYSAEQYRWIRQWPGLLSRNRKISVLSLALTHDYMFGTLDGSAMHQAIKDFSEGCLSAMTSES